MSVEERLERIESMLAQLLEKTDRMDRHVSFVENVYETVRRPFSNAICYLPSTRSLTADDKPSS